MKTGSKGKNIICDFEGLSLQAYQCQAGKWTIGYGHTNGVYKGMVITEAQAIQFLNQDLIVAEKAVNKLNRKFNQNQFDALVSFTFNLGEGNLKTLTKNRNNSQIAEAILLYNKASGKVSNGLVRRRKAERQLFLSPVINEQDKNTLPYDVITTSNLNIRTGPTTMSPIIKTVKKGTILTVRAILTQNNMIWGKNGNEWFCLDYCEKV